MTLYAFYGKAELVYSSEGASCSATNTNDTPLVVRQFPWGEYFSRTAGWLPTVARGSARFLSRMRHRLELFKRQLDPRTADVLLDEHETELGLSSGEDLPLAKRRLRVLAKRRAQTVGDGESLVNKAYYEELAKSLGYADAVVTDGGDPFFCNSQCTENLGGGGWLLTFVVTATSLGPELDAVLEEVIEGELLAGFFVVFELT